MMIRPNSTEAGTKRASSETTGTRRPQSTQVEGCPVCGHDLTHIAMQADGTDLIMQSCDFCDTRRWLLGNKRIDLAQALDHVGEKSGRRRS